MQHPVYDMETNPHRTQQPKALLAHRPSPLLAVAHAAETTALHCVLAILIKTVERDLSRAYEWAAWFGSERLFWLLHLWSHRHASRKVGGAVKLEASRGCKALPD